MPGDKPLTIYQGDDFGLLVQFQAGEPPAPFPVGGFTFRAQIRPVSADADAGAAALAEGLCEVVDANTVRVTFDHTLTEGLPTPKPLRWDLESTDANGWITTYLAGSVTVTAEVTR